MLKKDNKFELTTTIGRLKDITVDQLKCYEAIYIGDPFCELGRDNLLEDGSSLKKAIKAIKSFGKKVYLNTYVDPRPAMFDSVKHSVETALEFGADAIGVSNLGVLRMVSKSFPKAGIHLSNYVRLFNLRSAIFVSQFNVKRIVPYPELSLSEIDRIKANTSIPMELPVHGKIPLGHTELCILMPEQTKTKKKGCVALCYKGYMLRSGGSAMKAAGRVAFSHKDICMLNYLGMLLNKGYRHFRIESIFESGSYRRQIGEIYRQHIEFLLKNNDKFLRINPEGICNGFYFEKPGMEYV